MPSRDLMWYIDHALHALGRDVPQAYAAIQDAAPGLRLSVTTPKTAGTIAVQHPTIEVFGPAPDSDVTAQVNEQVIIDLIDGNLTLSDALSEDLLVLTGSQGDLETLVAGLQFFLRGAVRSTAIQALLDAFRDDALLSANF